MHFLHETNFRRAIALTLQILAVMTLNDSYEKAKIRPTANFDPGELEAFKEELNQPTVKPAFESCQITTDQQPYPGKLVHQSGEITKFGEIGVKLNLL